MMSMNPCSLSRVEVGRKRERLISPVGLFCLPLLLVLGLSHCTPVAAGDSANERRNARAVAQMVETEWPLRAANDPVTRYIQSLGQMLADVGNAQTEGERPERMSFCIIRDRAPYAFSTSGRIYLAEGAITFARDESELAAILAHEIGHHLAGHFSTPPGDYYPLSEDRNSSGRNAAPHRQSVGSLTQVFDLKKEEEADRQAVLILQRAGFNPHALLEVLKRLPAKGSYHYYNNEHRTQALQRELAGFSRQSRHNSKDFLTMQELIRNEQGE